MLKQFNKNFTQTKQQWSTGCIWLALLIPESAKERKKCLLLRNIELVIIASLALNVSFAIWLTWRRVYLQASRCTFLFPNIPNPSSLLEKHILIKEGPNLSNRSKLHPLIFNAERYHMLEVNWSVIILSSPRAGYNSKIFTREY